MTNPAPAAEASIRRDVASAYLATAAKIGSWVIVSGAVYRFLGAGEFATLALIRGTIGILNYTTLGLSPAMIRLLAEARRAPHDRGDDSIPAGADVSSLYANGLTLALICGAVGLLVTLWYAWAFGRIYQVPAEVRGNIAWIVLWMGCGTLLRLMSDAPGSVLQAHRLIARDNLLLSEAEALWVVLVGLVMVQRAGLPWQPLPIICFCYALSGAFLLLRRSALAGGQTHLHLPRWRLVNPTTLKRLLAFGSLVLFAQLADYLYAPTDYILINKLLGWQEVANYTPAMQIDAGLLLLVTGLSSVVLPRTALAHTAGEFGRVRRYYLYGTALSVILLTLAAGAVWIVSGLIFHLWLGNPMPATQAILPLVLVHTVVGGSSSVGRSILLGMGRVRPFTIAVLLGGAGNVLLSYALVRWGHLGLTGIVLGTIIAVVGRCAIWMPWYVMRAISRPDPR